ncbi:MAG: DUF2490 domain-containing protein [Dokdonia sp.]|jgi:hypothetical protein
MTLRTLGWLCLVLLIPQLTAKAQNTGEDQTGAWYMLFTNNRLSESLSLHAEAQHRNYEIGSRFNQLLLRTGLNYHLSDQAMLTMGYAYIATDGTFEEPPGEENTQEHRIYQQFVLRNKVGKLAFSHRYRLEQRFIDSPINGNLTEYRARYFLRLTYPLSEKWFLTAYDEVFINLQSPTFGQNRLFGAVGYHVSRQLSIQGGYLKNHFTNTVFDRLQLAVFLKTDWRKKDVSN